MEKECKVTGLATVKPFVFWENGASRIVVSREGNMMSTFFEKKVRNGMGDHVWTDVGDDEYIEGILKQMFSDAASKRIAENVRETRNNVQEARAEKSQSTKKLLGGKNSATNDKRNTRHSRLVQGENDSDRTKIDLDSAARRAAAKVAQAFKNRRRTGVDSAPRKLD